MESSALDKKKEKTFTREREAETKALEQAAKEVEIRPGIAGRMPIQRLKSCVESEEN